MKAEVSVPAALAVAAVVGGIYANVTPGLADIRATDAGDPHVQSTRKQAAWLAAGTVAGISLLAKDPTIFVLGGGMVIALDWYTRHADAVNPATGKASVRNNPGYMNVTQVQEPIADVVSMTGR